LGSYNATDISLANKELMSTPSPVCTRVCTNEAENANADPITTRQKRESKVTNPDRGDPMNALAATIRTLSKADQTRLAKLLLDE
jgi:hypothetical protein